MGRGRAKAKQTKVARELKYHSPNTDLEALQRELAGSTGENAENGTGRSGAHDEDEYDEDPYVRYTDEDDRGDDDASWAVRRD